MARNTVKPVFVTEAMILPPEVPGDVAAMLQGASVTLRLLMAAKAYRISDLNGQIPEHIFCSQELLDCASSSFLSAYVRNKTKENPLSLTVGMCDTCRRWRLLGSGFSIGTPKAGAFARDPHKCVMTLDCPGHMYVAHAASIAGKEEVEELIAAGEDGVATDEP